VPRTIRPSGLLPLLLLLAALAIPAAPARAATFTVTTTADSGAGSLRNAIQQAQSSPGSDTIAFAIGGSPDANGVWKITVSSALPTLDGTGGAIIIDGSTQAGGRTSGPNVYLDYTGGTSGVSGLTISSSGNTIREIGIINFTDSGILITGAGATSNTIVGNHIGLDGNGSSLAANEDFGIRIASGATNNTIGGTTAADRNVVSGHILANISLESTSSLSVVSGNQVVGNYVGSTAAGTAAVSNPGDGIELRNYAQGNTIRGNTVVGHRSNTTSTDTPSVGIVISSGSGPGRARNNIVAGNFVGTDPTGATALPNGQGIRITNGADTNTIGGASAGDANLVSGNALVGIVLQSSNTTANTVRGNRVGLSATGGRLANGADGIRIRSAASSNIIGPANIIAGNTNDGVRVTGSNTNGNIIRGNFIGTNPGGTSTSSNETNSSSGVRIDGGSGTVVGGTTAGDGNIIGANILNVVGVRIEPTAAPGTSGHTISNNRIGVRSDGTQRLATSDGTAYGILINGSASITITSNIIGGNLVGIELINGNPPAATAVTGVRIAGNLIGTDSDGTVNVGNTGDGIRLSNGATSNTVGGASAGDRNTIGRNGGNGIHVTSSGAGNNIIENNNLLNNGAAGVRVSGASGVRITRTTTSSNTGDGIDLVSGSGNGNMPAPTGLTFNAGTTTVTGNVDGTACASGCTVELFTSGTQENGEGPQFLRSISGVTGAFSIDASGCGQYVTATARNTGNNNTSPFATPMIFTSSVGCAAADISLTLTDRTPPGTGGVTAPATVVYTYTLLNNGGPGTVDVATSQISGPNWSGAPQSFGPFSLGTGATQTFAVTVNVPAGTAGGTTSTHRVTATAGAQEVFLNTTTTVSQTFGVDIEPPLTRTYSGGSVTLTFPHTITNTGNGVDTIGLSAASAPAGLTFNFVGGNSCAGIAAGTSCNRTLEATLPASPAASYVITVTATGSGGAVDTVVNQAIGQAAAPGLTPSANRTVDVFPGETVIFTRTLQNVGNEAGTFIIAEAEQPPANGVVSTLLSPANVPLAIGETTIITLETTIPDYPSAPISGTIVSTLLSATSDDGVAASAIEAVRIRLSPRAELTAATSPVDRFPLQTAIFTHTLSNTSNGDDSYAVVITPTSRLENVTLRYGPDAGNLTTVALPTGGPIGGRTVTIAVPRTQSRLVIVSAQVQAGTLVSEPQSIDISAQTVSAPPIAAPPERTDEINILGAAVGLLSPAQAQSVALPGPLSYTRTITNSGNQAGDFSISYQAPSGWLASTGPLTPPDCLSALAPGAACDFTVVVTPTADAIAGPYLLRVIADVTSAPTSSSFVNDTITVEPAPGVALAPDRSASAGPDAPVIYTHTLTNTGNVTTTYTLNVTSVPGGWSAPLVTSEDLTDVPPAATRAVTLTVQTPPLEPAGGPFDIVLQAAAQGAPTVTASVTDSTTIIGADAARFTPENAAQSLTAGTDPVTATYALNLFNTGNTTISYTLSLDPASLPDGWTASVIPTTTVVLAPSLVSSTPVTVSVIAPAGASGQQVVQVRASSGAGGPVLASATLTTTINAAVTDLLTPDLNISDARPGETVIYTHTLRNIRGVEDTYLLSLITPFGYEATITPPSVTLPAGATRLIAVAISVPTIAQAGTIITTTLTATSASDSDVTDSAREQTTVTQVPAASLSPRLFSNGPNGTTVEFRHSLRNLGNARDTFTIEAEGTLNWPITIVVTQTTLNVDATNPSIRVLVDVPADAPPGAVNRITVRAISTFNDQEVASVVNTIGLAPAEIDPTPPRVYFPSLSK
jgi:uncharacterized membrane protein